MPARTKAIYNKLMFSALIIFLIVLMQPLEVYIFSKDISVLFPSGLIALKQRSLLLFIQALMLLFIIPIYILTFAFSWWYRSTNPQSKYDPHLIDNTIAEFIWWGVPLVMTIIVAVFTWIETYALDPYKPIASSAKPLRIEAVALQWKWLFIYPDEGIATVNYMKVPTNVPLEFHITADAPMNSLWIPALGGQMYAMPGMRTKLHLIADHEGSFRGSSANISGEGFAGMTFITEATPDDEYRRWVDKTKREGGALAYKNYRELAKPSKNNPVTLYHLQEPHLFDRIIMRYMQPTKEEG